MPVPVARLLAVGVLVLSVATGCGGLGDDAASERVAQFAAGSDRELAQAVVDDDAAEVRRLLDAGGDPDAGGRTGLTVLQLAVLAHRLEPERALVEAGADTGRIGESGRTAVHTAAFEDDASYLDVLLDGGADPNVPDRAGSTPLVTAILNSSDAPLERLLEDPDLDVDRADANADTALHTAARTNNGRVVLLLLDRGADPLAENSGGATFQDYYFTFPEEVLNERARAEHLEVAAWLVAHGVPLHPEAPRLG